MSDRDIPPSTPASASRQQLTFSPRAPGRSAAQRDFARRVNHALRGDVHAVGMALSEALEQARAASLPASAREAFARLERAVTYMERRALDIALLTQAESGALELARQPERLKWVIEEASGNYREMASRYSVRLRLDLATCGTAAPPLDREFMTRALGALLDNAIRFSPPGGVVSVHGERDGGVARITVRDQGSGFAPGDERRVFKPFAVGKNEEDGSGNGLGLGLAVARVIIEAHGGRIWVVASKEQGGAVTIELPLA